MSSGTGIEPLGTNHLLETFDCGEPSLDAWSVERARWNQADGYSRTYVIAEQDRVIAYSALSSFAIWRSDASGRTRRQAPRQIPAILLGRLAVDKRAQGQGLGAALLRHAMELSVTAASTIGVRLLVVSAVDPRAADFYRRFGLEPSPTNPLDLMITVNDIAASMPNEG